jgi:hypothetical protein
MSENTYRYSWYGLLALILAVVCAFIVAEQRDDLKQEAVKRGFAEWIVIGQNQTEFKWKEKQ